MLKNYFITAIRTLRRNKIFSAINVLGLSVGISAALVIFLITWYEFSYDSFIRDKSDVYRVVLDASFNGNDGHSAGIPAPVSTAIKKEASGIELSIPVMQFQGDATATVGITRNSEKIEFKQQPGIVFTNSSYFSLLPYQWTAGTPTTVLNAPSTVVLTEKRAKEYFPSLPATDIIGKQISYNNDITATVSGVVKDLDKTTTFTAVEFISFATIAETHLQNDFMMNVWNDWMAYSQAYIKLVHGREAAGVEKQLNAIFAKYNKDTHKDAANWIALRLQPLQQVHFDNQYAGVGQRIAHKPTLYGLLLIAVFLLLSGCINFINLTTANAAERAKEIGIRKTMGSSRRQLVIQFLGETLLITTIAGLLSFFIAPVLLKAFSDFIPAGLTAALLYQPVIITFLTLLIIVVSFLSGLYPALILAGYKTVDILKSQSQVSSKETRHAWIRKTLTVSQFVIAQFFIIATVMVSKQINYSINADLGFNKEGVVTFEIPRDTVTSHISLLLDKVKAIPEVSLAATGFLPPASEGAAFTDISYEPVKNVNAPVQIRWGDPDYLAVYKIKLLAGRNVVASDTMKEFVINSTYAKMLGFQQPDEAIGKLLSFNNKKMPIVGVMQDFNAQSTHGSIGPLVFAGNKGHAFHIQLKPNKANGVSWQQAIAKMQVAYKSIYPESDLKYSFFDETIARMYATEQRTASLLRWATALAITISSLGLLGLVMFTIHTRTKEIGIRKILGATVVNIVSILSKDFMKLVCIAFAVAAPIAWWATDQWLQNYVYRTSMSWWVFVLCGFSMLLITVLVLGVQTIRAAITNPVKSLRAE
ncbi:MAG: ABC transporter permease [Chitinophagaceae bacterium]